MGNKLRNVKHELLSSTGKMTHKTPSLAALVDDAHRCAKLLPKCAWKGNISWLNRPANANKTEVECQPLAAYMACIRGDHNKFCEMYRNRWNQWTNLVQIFYTTMFIPFPTTYVNFITKKYVEHIFFNVGNLYFSAGRAKHIFGGLMV